MAEQCTNTERLAMLEVSMEHMKENLSRLNNDVRDIKRDTKADFDRMRAENQQAFAEVKRVIDTAVGNLSKHLDERISQINSSVSSCSKTNGERLSKLEHEQTHTKGVTKGVVAIISAIAAGVGALVAAVTKMGAQ